MSKELQLVEKLFKDLLAQSEHTFPMQRERITASNEKGVYIIINTSQSVVHVGRTPRARRGVAQRLKDHLYARSSFTIDYLEGDGDYLRGRYKYKYLVVDDARHRALLEAYAIAHLCPRHLGLGES